MPPKRKQETANLAVTSSSKRNLRNRNKWPQEAATPAAAVASSPKSRNKQPEETTIPAAEVASSPKKKHKQSQETAIPADTLADSSASSPSQKRAKPSETTIPILAAGSSSLPELLMDLTYDQARMLAEHLMIRFNFNLRDLYDTGVGVESSSITYAQAAPRVELDPDMQLRDIRTFEIHRSRIQIDLFKAIITDLDTMRSRYGPFHVHQNEESKARFFSIVFDQLVKPFSFMLRNEPETIMTGQIGTKGRIQHFLKVFGIVAILCIQMNLEGGNGDERLNAIAQCIAECDDSDLINADKDLSLPVYCILSDGFTFEFFKFTRDRLSSRSSFFRGCFPGDPETLQRGLVLPDVETMSSPLPFILQFRCICETMFDIMLNAYISAVKASHDRLISKSKYLEDGMKKPSLDAWDQALKLANSALTTLREAENQRAKGLLVKLFSKDFIYSMRVQELFGLYTSRNAS